MCQIFGPWRPANGSMTPVSAFGSRGASLRSVDFFPSRPSDGDASDAGTIFGVFRWRSIRCDFRKPLDISEYRIRRAPPQSAARKSSAGLIWETVGSSWHDPIGSGFQPLDLVMRSFRGVAPGRDGADRWSWGSGSFTSFRMTSAGLRMTSAGLRMTSAGFRMTSVGLRMTIAKFRMTSAKFRMSSARFGMTSF